MRVTAYLQDEPQHMVRAGRGLLNYRRRTLTPSPNPNSAAIGRACDQPCCGRVEVLRKILHPHLLHGSQVGQAVVC